MSKGVLLFIFVLALVLPFASCALDNPAAQQEIENLSADIQNLQKELAQPQVDKEKVAAEMKSIRARLENLQEQGYSLWEILGAAASTFLLGMLGISRSASWTRLRGLLGLAEVKEAPSSQ